MSASSNDWDAVIDIKYIYDMLILYHFSNKCNVITLLIFKYRRSDLQNQEIATEYNKPNRKQIISTGFCNFLFQIYIAITSKLSRYGV